MSVKSTMLGAAALGIIAGTLGTACQKGRDGSGASPPSPAATTGATVSKHACKGQNDCKGQGGCSTNDHGCRGQNTCKGQGGCKTS
ncbi:MAG: hypothetical protein ABSC94_16940 [Polyangiaceae bacterium]|jgi:hypothetical protein